MNNKDIGRRLAEINNLILRHKLQLSDTKNLEQKLSDVSHAGSCIIAYLHDHSDKDVFQRDLEREFLVRRSTISKVLSALEQKSYIERIAVESDHRLKKIALTDKACSVVNNIKKDRANLEKQMTNGISQQELLAFMKTLDKIKQNLCMEDNK